MKQHTPGPWNWDGNPCNYDATNDAPWLVGAQGEYPPVLGGTITCTKEANARLIAAAPELLEALKWYVETDEVDNSEGNEFWLEGKAKAIAAIAKATVAA